MCEAFAIVSQLILLIYSLINLCEGVATLPQEFGLESLAMYSELQLELEPKTRFNGKQHKDYHIPAAREAPKAIVFCFHISITKIHS